MEEHFEQHLLCAMGFRFTGLLCCGVRGAFRVCFFSTFGEAGLFFFASFFFAFEEVALFFFGFFFFEPVADESDSKYSFRFCQHLMQKVSSG